MSTIPPNKTVQQDKDIAVHDPKITGNTGEREQLSVVLDNLDQGLQTEIARAEAAEAALAAENNRLSGLIQQNEVSKLTEGGTWSLNSTTLSWSSPSYVQVPGLPKTSNTIPAGSLTLANDGDIAYVLLNRSISTPTNLSITTTSQTAFASLSKADKENAFVIARRIGSRIVGPGYQLISGQSQTLDATMSDQTRALLGVSSEAQSSPAWQSALGAPLRNIASDSTPVLTAIASVDTELSKLFGQLRITKSTIAPAKALISGVDLTLLDQSVFTHELFGLFLAFTGAVIDFSTGVTTKEDGSTALGINITPAPLTDGDFVWYGITLTPGTIDATNRMQGLVLLNQGAIGASEAAAGLPVVTDGLRVGAVLVKNTAGVISVVRIRQFDIAASSKPPGGKASPLDPKETETWTYYTRSDFSVDSNNFVSSTSGNAQILGLNKIMLGLGQQIISTDLTGPQVWQDSLPVDSAQAKILFNVGHVDEVGTVEMSRDGGLNWVTGSDFLPGADAPATFFGNILVADVSFSGINPAVVNSTGNGATISGQRVAAIIRPAYRMTITSVMMALSTSSTTGTIKASLYNSTFGTPQTLIETGIQTLVAGVDVTSTPKLITVSIPPFTLQPGVDYAITFEGSGLTGNLIAYTATSPDAQVRSSTLHNGSGWVPNAAIPVVSLFGTGADLRMRYTAGAASTEVNGFGVNYVADSAALVTGGKSWEAHAVTTSEASTGYVTLQNVRYTPGAKQLQVHRLGLVYMAPDFVEIGERAVQFPTGFLTAGQTLRFINSYGLVDGTNSGVATMNARLTGIYDAVIGTAADVTYGRATHSSLTQAIADSAVGARVLLTTAVTENISINKKMTVDGRGHESIINGTLSIAAPGVLVNMLQVNGNITFTSTAVGCFMNNSWQPAANNVTDLGSANLYVILDA